MNCIAPLHIEVKRYTYRWERQPYDVPCGRCINCLITKQSQLEFLAKKELLSVYTSGRGASFVTLTYDDVHLPVNDNGLVTLRRRDLQLWLKGIRRQMDYYKEKVPFKVIYAGELGDKFQRPHYHVIFLGLTDAQVSKYCRKLWYHGLSQVGPLGQGGLRYLIDYISKSKPHKDIKLMRKSLGVESPFIGHSIGLGKQWILQNMWKIAQNGYQFNLNGKKYFYPKYVMRFVALHTGVSYKYYVLKDAGNRLGSQVRRLGFDRFAIDYEEQENRYLRYMSNIACLKSKNIPVDSVDLDAVHWVKPRAFNVYKRAREYTDSLADYAIYGDVVPF